MVGLEGVKVKSADKAIAAMVTLADFVATVAGEAESVPVTLMLKVPFTLYVVLKLVPMPEDGLPPVAVQENVTGGVLPVDVAVHATAIPTVPVVGQLIDMVNTAAWPTAWVAVAVFALASVTVRDRPAIPATGREARRSTRDCQSARRLWR